MKILRNRSGKEYLYSNAAESQQFAQVAEHHVWIQGQDNIPLEALQKLTDASVGTLLFTGKENENDREQGVRHTAGSKGQTQACSITSQQRKPISSEMSLLPSSGSVRQTVAGFRFQRTRVDLQSARMLITEGGRPGCGCDWKHREPFYLFQHLMELPAVGMKPPRVPSHFC